MTTAALVRPDWELERKRLPERYTVCLDANLLDQHTYPPTRLPRERSSEQFELTKQKAKQMILQMPGIPVQVFHGTDDENEQGHPNTNLNKCVIGHVVEGWIDPDDDKKLMCEIKLDNSKNTSLFWNHAIHATGASRGASLTSYSDYYFSTPHEVSLLDKGARPNTGIVDVITEDGQRIKFELYKLQHDESVLQSPPSPSPQPLPDPVPQKK